VGMTELIFVNPGVKVKGQYYCNVLLSQHMLPAIKRVTKRCLCTKQYVTYGEIGHFLCSVISQGKVIALDRWGGKWNQISMTHRLTTNYAKNYCNRTLIVKVTVENVVTCFFGTRCSCSCTHLRATGRHLPKRITHTVLPATRQMNAPRLNSIHKDGCSVNLPQRDGMLSWHTVGGWLADSHSSKC